jgi:hypothetical protein
VCRVPGCGRMSMLQDYRGGVARYRNVCYRHHRMALSRMTVDECGLCGWAGRVHVHRPVPGAAGGRYEVGNVVLRCPNCHAAEHADGEFNLEFARRLAENVAARVPASTGAQGNFGTNARSEGQKDS